MVIFFVISYWCNNYGMNGLVQKVKHDGVQCVKLFLHVCISLPPFIHIFSPLDASIAAVEYVDVIQKGIISKYFVHVCVCAFEQGMNFGMGTLQQKMGFNMHALATRYRCF